MLSLHVYRRNTLQGHIEGKLQYSAEKLGFYRRAENLVRVLKKNVAGDLQKGIFAGRLFQELQNRRNMSG